MFFKTVYTMDYNEDLPHKAEAVFADKTHITFFKKGDKWFVVFDDKSYPEYTFDGYGDTVFFFNTAVTRMEKMFNARMDKEKALKDLEDKIAELERAEDKLQEWLRDQ